MAGYIFKKEMGKLCDTFSVLNLYTRESSLEKLHSPYNLKPDPRLSAAYNRIYAYIDERIGYLKPLFVTCADGGNLFSKFAKETLAVEDGTIDDIMRRLKAISPEQFLYDFMHYSDYKSKFSDGFYEQISKSPELLHGYLADLGFNNQDRRSIMAMKRKRDEICWRLEALLHGVYSCIEKEYLIFADELEQFQFEMEGRFDNIVSDFLAKYDISFCRTSGGREINYIYLSLHLFPQYSAQYVFSSDVAAIYLSYGYLSTSEAEKFALPDLYVRMSPLSNVTRWRIIKKLSAGRLTLNELSDALCSTKKDLAYHLKVLEYSKYIIKEKSGADIVYRLNTVALKMTSIYLEDTFGKSN